jgi:hypothetical protein
MTITAKDSVMAAYPGANNMVGVVEPVENPGSSEISPVEQGSAGAAMAPYPHDENGAGGFTGPVGQPEQNLGNP